MNPYRSSNLTPDVKPSFYENALTWLGPILRLTKIIALPIVALSFVLLYIPGLFGTALYGYVMYRNKMEYLQESPSVDMLPWEFKDGGFWKFYWNCFEKPINNASEPKLEEF